jgi:hypothetical protein
MKAGEILDILSTNIKKLCQILISVPAVAPLPSFTRQNAAIKHKEWGRVQEEEVKTLIKP